MRGPKKVEEEKEEKKVVVEDQTEPEPLFKFFELMNEVFGTSENEIKEGEKLEEIVQKDREKEKEREREKTPEVKSEPQKATEFRFVEFKMSKTKSYFLDPFLIFLMTKGRKRKKKLRNQKRSRKKGWKKRRKRNRKVNILHLQRILTIDIRKRRRKRNTRRRARNTVRRTIRVTKKARNIRKRRTLKRRRRKREDARIQIPLLLKFIERVIKVFL